MSLSLTSSSVNNLVNTLFRVNGRDASSPRKEDGFKVSQGVKNTFGDTFVSGQALKNTLNDPGSRVALSLKDNTHPEAAMEVSQLVAQGLDRADGREDGLIKVNDSSNWWSGKSQVSTQEVANMLASGSLVIGEGGQLMGRQEAKAHGDIIIAAHENKAGPTIALDQ